MPFYRLIRTMGVEELRRRNEAELETLRKEQAENKSISESAKREYEIFVENKSQKEEEFRNLKIQVDNSMRRIGEWCYKIQYK